MILDGTPFQDDKDAETLSSKSTAESVSEDLSDFVNRPIHLAAKSGNLEIIKELARYKANLNAINEQRQTALHISTAHSKFQVRKNLRKFDTTILTPYFRQHNSF